MKTICTLLFSFVIAGAAMGQERFPLPEYSIEEKTDALLFQWWSIFTGGIHFAKAAGAEPYDYGRYLGKLYAPSWNQETGHEGLVKSMIRMIDLMKNDEEGPLEVQEESDGSVMLRIPLDSWKKYFEEGNLMVTFDDAMKCMLGMSKEIASTLHCGITLSITEWNVGFVITPPA